MLSPAPVEARLHMNGPYDAIVVGAGPAGSTAAYHLAIKRRRVLLVEACRFPRDKSCGDLLTGRAVRTLAEMGVLALLPNANDRIRGVRVHMRGHGSRDLDYSVHVGRDRCGLVLPRYVLDEAVCQRAVAAGATLWDEATVTTPVIEHGRVVGVQLRHAGQLFEVRAPVVVAADGARSGLAQAVGLCAPDSPGSGVAIRGYMAEVDDLSDIQEIFLPLTDVTERNLLPSYGWIHPMGTSKANIGVALFEPSQEGHLHELLDRFVARLREERGGLASSRLVGDWKSAPLRFDFSPHRCVGTGIMLVGDAAGLVSPFTGEGISYALESGKTAAEVIDRGLKISRRNIDLLDYSMLLKDSYSGYFETGQRSTHRYKLAWRVLEGTFGSERPPFVLFRRAVLLPEGAGELKTSRLVDDVDPILAPGVDVRSALLGVGEVMTTAVRDEWPFLGRLALSSWGDPGVPFRPALLLLLASSLEGPDIRCLIDVAAAVELGCLAALVQLGVENNPTVHEAAQSDQEPSPHSNWGNKFSILVGDLLLAKALQLAAHGGPTVLELMSSAITSACTGQLRGTEHAFDLELDEDEHLQIIGMKTATLFELPCRLGGQLSGVDPSHVQALGRYGRNLGIAFQLTDDMLDLMGDATELGKPTGTDLREGVFSHSVLVAVRQNPKGTLARLLGRASLTAEEAAQAVALVRESGALEVTGTVARGYADRAAKALASLPEGPARTSLLALTSYAVTRKVPERPDLLTLLD
ncbi:geranylgeranyl reductase family protein [Streptomyces sp. NPDC102259]|uniref:geranylgeranyl reductase family protein n=1 Tax=Streptomyces sp. NPDC102259 TaxID=3366148 RepID=UPI0037FDFC6C